MKQVKDEGILSAARFINPPQLTKKQCDAAVAHILKQIDRNLESFTDKFPDIVSNNLIYAAADNYEWTPGFWTGMLWLAYEVTGDEKYRRVADRQLLSFKKRADEQIGTETHDLGFLYSLSCVAAYKLTGNEEAKQTALRAADLLMSRYLEHAGIIQAWGSLSNPKQRGRMIIDCCLNTPLLYWAAEITGNRAYSDAAATHVKQAAAYLIREDASSFHTYYMDVDSGAPLYGKTAQGFSDDSCWSRGQAWAIYGFPLNYIYTKDQELLDLTKKVANYLINRLPEDYVCYWDLIFTSGSEVRDSSAAAIAVCGMLELNKHLSDGDPHKAIYANAASSILLSLIDNYSTVNTPESNGLLLHGVYSKPGNSGVDECCLWGDYFYFEALVRVTRDWKTYW
ncbi:glycoside hydrolase family 88 protein [Paenibacillus alba]|uniref:Glycoside hydrolase family 88 protein n=1 Tax=Paenibacillus alba TaxID=1197127 RepID=A0ABU6G0U8_9BACL|nr:glycoside hydrolase family 88 protein [Paenibacillus alba]MEC0227793.1 glycoside hydrolase family 88 protein [Paenibacillus alba]